METRFNSNSSFWLRNQQCRNYRLLKLHIQKREISNLLQKIQNWHKWHLFTIDFASFLYTDSHINIQNSILLNHSSSFFLAAETGCIKSGTLLTWDTSHWDCQHSISTDTPAVTTICSYDDRDQVSILLRKIQLKSLLLEHKVVGPKFKTKFIPNQMWRTTKINYCKE